MSQMVLNMFFLEKTLVQDYLTLHLFIFITVLIRFLYSVCWKQHTEMANSSDCENKWHWESIFPSKDNQDNEKSN